MSVYKPQKGRFFQYDFVYQGRRFHGSTGAETRKQAQAVENAKRLAAAKGELDRIEIPTLDVAAAEWWDVKGRDLKSAPTLEPRLELAVRLVGKHKPVNEITTADISRAIAKRRGMVLTGKRLPANATVNRDIISTVRPILRRQAALLNDGRGPGVQFPVIRWGELELSEPKPRPRDFSRADIGALLEALPRVWHDFVTFQMTYGCRLAEMFFPLEAVDPHARRLLLMDRKGGDDNLLPLRADDAAMLAARIGRARAAGIDTPWFRELKGGRLKALTYHAAKDALRRAMRSSGLHAAKGAKGSHDLRHHAGMQYLRATGNLRATQRLLGHADMKSTLVYAHALEGDLRAGLEGLPRYSPETDTPATESIDETKVSA